MTLSNTGVRLLITMPEIPNETSALQPIRKVLPLIPLRNIVLFPSVETSLFFGRKESMNSLLHAYDNTNKLVLIVTQQNPKTENPKLEDLYSVGVLAKIEHVLQTDGSLHAIVKGIFQ